MLHHLCALLSAQAGSIAIIGGADGPTAIYTAGGSDLSHVLTLAWQGMAGIFTVMIVIALLVWALSKITSGGGPKNSGESEEQ